MLKKLGIVLALVVVFAVIGISAFVLTAPELPENTQQIVEEVMNEPLPEFITGKTGKAKNGEVSIWYQVIAPETEQPKGTVLVVMGQGMGALGMPLALVKTFNDSGYQVVLTDHRGVGESDWLEGWSKDAPYSLEDMAADNIAVLDAVGVKKAHVLGFSMGGMISQVLASDHPERIASLTSVMSSGNIGDPELPAFPEEHFVKVMKLFFRHAISGTEEGNVKFMVGMLSMIQGDDKNAMDMKQAAQAMLYEMRNRAGINHQAAEQHAVAIGETGSLYNRLPGIKAPTLVIHGKADPIIDSAHAEKYAAMIPNSKLILIDGMGHEISQRYNDQWSPAFVKMIEQN